MAGLSCSRWCWWWCCCWWSGDRLGRNEVRVVHQPIWFLKAILEEGLIAVSVCEGSIVHPIDRTDWIGPWYDESAARSRHCRGRVVGKVRIDCSGNPIRCSISLNDYIPVVSAVPLSLWENNVGILHTITWWMEIAVCTDWIAIDENTYISRCNQLSDY